MAAVHSKEFVKKVLDLRYKDGLSARQITKELGSEFLMVNKREMTKNIVIGIWNRNKYLVDKQDIIKEQVKALENIVIVKPLHIERKKIKQEHFRKRKCLSCRKEMLLEKNLYICEPCKKSENYKFSTTQHTYHTGGA
tara:strand:+ start:1541 stop:1954 length:414 start_codon:yes stop_codon:yes gene_type:complete